MLRQYAIGVQTVNHVNQTRVSVCLSPQTTVVTPLNLQPRHITNIKTNTCTKPNKTCLSMHVFYITHSSLINCIFCTRFYIWSLLTPDSLIAYVRTCAFPYILINYDRHTSSPYYLRGM